jgi:hypothetical protein
MKGKWGISEIIGLIGLIILSIIVLNACSDTYDKIPKSKYNSVREMEEAYKDHDPVKPADGGSAYFYAYERAKQRRARGES